MTPRTHTLARNTIAITAFALLGSACIVSETDSFDEASELAQTLDEKDEGKSCVPLNEYHEAAAREYFNDDRNYCHADDMCFNRACAMVGAVDAAFDKDLRGKDGKWCSHREVGPSTTGKCDDLAYKVVIRYATERDSDWSYHIASVVKTCEKGLCVIDPIGSPSENPTADCITPKAWCEAWAHDNDDDGISGEFGDDWGWGDTHRASRCKDICEIVPANQHFWHNLVRTDPCEAPALDKVCRALAEHTAELCRTGIGAFPPECGVDSDNDGIPDAYDKCKNSPPGEAIDYCDPENLGCALPDGADRAGKDDDEGTDYSCGGPSSYTTSGAGGGTGAGGNASASSTTGAGAGGSGAGGNASASSTTGAGAGGNTSASSTTGAGAGGSGAGGAGGYPSATSSTGNGAGGTGGTAGAR